MSCRMTACAFLLVVPQYESQCLAILVVCWSATVTHCMPAVSWWLGLPPASLLSGQPCCTAASVLLMSIRNVSKHRIFHQTETHRIASHISCTQWVKKREGYVLRIGAGWSFVSVAIVFQQQSWTTRRGIDPAKHRALNTEH
ncbi:hypothetical protein F5Y16DRAFT_365482 [Xylariaceae sp. FL0255]|nr:hypothetical protein F5Y16DRAFT_365482 [Xylariaceae sp. FL0255]